MEFLIMFDSTGVLRIIGMVIVADEIAANGIVVVGIVAEATATGVTVCSDH